MIDADIESNTVDSQLIYRIFGGRNVMGEIGFELYIEYCYLIIIERSTEKPSFCSNPSLIPFLP
jgi:hypothetical protein